MEVSRRPCPPKSLGKAIPRIYLNTTTRLLPEENGLSSSQSCSLPNLSSVEGKGAKKCDLKQIRRGSHDERRSLEAESVSVYCSPRVLRKTPRPPCAPSGDTLSPSDIDSWASPRRRNRGRQSSMGSVDSECSWRSASHVSTYATSDGGQFTSCDRLSMIPMTTDNDADLEFCSGGLRRINSNPEGSFLKDLGLTLRDSKSCSNLQSGRSRALLGQTLYQEYGNLLSPPAIYPTTLVRKMREKEKEGNCSYEQLYDELLNDPELKHLDLQNNREVRIQQWLQNISFSANQSTESNTSTGSQS